MSGKSGQLFDKDYMEYWQKSVQKSVDGTVIAGPQIAMEFLPFLNLNKQSKVLDLGCSFGRMFEPLQTTTPFVYGVEIDPQVVLQAQEKSYQEVKQGRAEEIPFGNHFFDGVFSWAVFDVVDQVKAMIEVNRVLRSHGTFLVTGKNSDYPDDDQLGFVAERNAFLKKFPNQFTNLKRLKQFLPRFGFQIEKIFLFEKRGDFGLNKFIEINLAMRADLPKAYEFLLILKKVQDAENLSAPEAKELNWCSPVSETAKMKAGSHQLENLEIFFQRDFELTEKSRR